MLLFLLLTTLTIYSTNSLPIPQVRYEIAGGAIQYPGSYTANHMNYYGTHAVEYSTLYPTKVSPMINVQNILGRLQALGGDITMNGRKRLYINTGSYTSI